jgi:ribonuclease BN (tRNA processing enzyme)
MTDSDNSAAESDAQAPVTITPDVTRRSLLWALTATAGIAAAPGTSSAATRAEPHPVAPDANTAEPQLIVLGTGGGPLLAPDRQMSGYVLVVDGHLYLIDCGYGVALQVARAGLDLRLLDSVFVTHHHPDHNIDLGSVLMLTWLSRRHDPIKVFGPPPIAQMVVDYKRMMAPTIDLWIKDLKVPAFPSVSCQELSQAGTVMSDARVRVSAAVVQHPPIVPALAYRFDIGTRSIVFSGDTVARDELVQLAEGADILVHEAMNGPVIEQMIRTAFKQRVAAKEPYAEGYSADEWIKHMRRGHTPVAEVGRIAAKAGVKTLVLSHLVPSFGIKDRQWRADAATHFSGRIIVARDLMTIPI